MRDITANDDSSARFYAVLLCLFAGVVLFVFRANELSGMSIQAAATAVMGEWAFMPHHLIYKPTVQVLSGVFGVVGCDPICAGQLHSIGWALATIAATFVIVRKLTGSILVGVLSGLFLLGTKGFWVYATQLETYSLVIGVNAIIAAIFITRSDRALSRGEIALVTGLFTWSLFYHQANVFYLLPLGLYLFLVYGRTGLQTIFWITAISGVVSASVNAIIFWSLYPGDSIGDFYRWLTYYGVISNDTHGDWREIMTLDLARISGAFRQTVKVFVEVPDGGLQKPLRLAFFAVFAFAVAWNIFKAWQGKSYRHERILMIATVLGFGFFGYWWQPNVYKFYLFIVAPLTVLCALTVNDILQILHDSSVPRMTVAGAASAFAFAVIGFNMAGTAGALNSSQTPIHSMADRQSDATPGNCGLYTLRAIAGYVGYFHEREHRPFNLMFRKFRYESTNPDAARALRVSIDMKTEECAVIPLYWMSEPYFMSRNRSTRLVDDGDNDQYASPDWIEFLEWMLNGEQMPGDGSLSHDSFEVFLHENEAYVRIDRRTRTISASPNELMEEISSAVGEFPLGGVAGDEYRQAGEFRGRAFGYF